MSFIASMVSAAAVSAGASALVGGIAGAAATGAVGAGLGAGIGAATGGDAGQGALMGGIGGLGAGAGAILGGATMGAEAIGEGAAAGGAEGAAAGGAGGASSGEVLPGATSITGDVGQSAINPALVNAGDVQTPLSSATNITNTANAQNALMPTFQSGAVQPSAVNPATTAIGNANPIDMSQAANNLNTAYQGTGQTVANNAGWGQQLLNKAGIESQVGSKIGGQALENAVYGAGINGLLAGAQGQDVGKAMGIGALSGGIGGAAGAGLAEAPGAVGEFAAAHPMITSGAIGMGANTALNGLTTSNPSAPDYKGIRSNVKWNPNVYKPYGPQFAAGGITDLDNYDAAPNQPITAPPGTLNIPNRAEVANNEGYVGDSVQLMAKGGLSYGGGGLLGNLPGANLMQSVYNTTLGDVISPDLRDFLFGTPDEQLSPEQRRKKAQLMQQEGSSKGMAHGGISDLGGYSDGGRLLKGPGTGVSDDIPATIEGKQPARLAANEFVIPSRIVSEIGNGSTDAGAKALYAMMDRVQNDRKKSIGKGKFAVDSKASRHLDAL